MIQGRILNEKEVMEVLQYRMPRALQYAMADSLNRLVYLGYRETETVLAVDLTRRNKAFSNRSRAYFKTKGTIPVDSMKASFATVALPRSTGWVEQPVSGIDRRKRKWTANARGKGGRGTVKQKFRLKRGTRILDLSKVREKKLGYLMRIIEGRNYFDRPVSIPYGNKYNIAPGLVSFSEEYRNVYGHMMRRIDRLANYERNIHVDKVDILGRAWSRVEGYGVQRIVWKNVKKQLGTIKVRT